MTLFGFLTNPMEWAVVAFIALLFFGNRLPSVMRSLGQGVTEFKKGMDGVSEDDLDRPKRVDNNPPREDTPPSHNPT